MLTVKDGKNKDWSGMSLFDLAQGNAEDIYMTFKIHTLLKEEVEKVGLTKLYRELISPLLNKFAKAEREGMRIDESLLPEIGEKLSALIEQRTKELRAIPEVKDYNLDSPAQKAKILFTDEDGFALYPPKLSKKTGKPSTDSKCLTELVMQIEEELEYRSRKKK